MAHKHTDECNHEPNQENQLQMQIMQSQMKNLENQYSNVDMKLAQLAEMKEILEDAGKADESESFSEIGLGIYAETKMKKVEKLLVNIGAGLLVKRSVSEVRAILDSQIEKLGQVQQEIINEIETLSINAQKLNQK